MVGLRQFLSFGVNQQRLTISDAEKGQCHTVRDPGSLTSPRSEIFGRTWDDNRGQQRNRSDRRTEGESNKAAGICELS